MKISEAIAELQRRLEEKGDLEMFDYEGWPILGFDNAEKEEYVFPVDWNMPDEFIVVKNGS